MGGKSSSRPDRLRAEIFNPLPTRIIGWRKLSGGVMETNAELEKQVKEAKTQDELLQVLTNEATKQIALELKTWRCLKRKSRRSLKGTPTSLLSAERKWKSPAPIPPRRCASIRPACRFSRLAARNSRPNPRAEAHSREEIQAKRLELDTQFRLGNISAEEYLEKSGAVDSYLEKKGIKVAELTEVIKDRELAKEKASWETATNEFITDFSKAGTPWVGGTKVLDLMSKSLRIGPHR